MKKPIVLGSNGELDLNEFSDVLDVASVDTVKIENLDDGSLVLTFFDKDGEQIKLKQGYCGAV